MTLTIRILLAVAIVLVDVALFALPLTGLLAAYIILARPAGFPDLINQLYGRSQPQPNDEPPT